MFLVKSSGFSFLNSCHSVKDPQRFGIAKSDERGKVLGIIEKPSLEEAKSYRNNDVYRNIAGVLILKHKIFAYIEKTKPGKGNACMHQ